MWLDYAFVAMGFLLLIVAAFGRFFYYGDPSTSSKKQAPVVSSKVFFVLIGLIFIALGMLHLFGVITPGKE